MSNILRQNHGGLSSFLERVRFGESNPLESWHLQNLTEDKIGYEGVEKIAEALKINNTLTTLHFRVRFAFWKIIGNNPSNTLAEINIIRIMQLEYVEQRRLEKH